MTSEKNIEKGQYIRLLELVSIISEEWGEVVKEINDYNWKGKNRDNLIKAIYELNQLSSPIMELDGLLNIMNLKQIREEKEVKQKKLSD